MQPAQTGEKVLKIGNFLATSNNNIISSDHQRPRSKIIGSLAYMERGTKVDKVRCLYLKGVVGYSVCFFFFCIFDIFVSAFLSTLGICI